MKDTDFAKSSGYLRVLEKRIISKSGLERAADAANTRDALRILSQGGDYDFNSLKRPDDYEQVLKAELRRVYELARSLTDSPEIVDIPGCKYDYHNIKTAVKAKYFKQRTESPYIQVTETSPKDIEKLVMGDVTAEKSGLPRHLADAAVSCVEGFEKDKNPQAIDLALDLDMFCHMLEQAQKTGSEMISEYVKMSIDFFNIKTLLRAKDMQMGTAFLTECLAEGGKTPVSEFIENYARTPAAMVPQFYFTYFGDQMRLGVESFENTGNYSMLERLLDNLLISHTVKSKYITFGPELLFSYILNKENEVRQIRILITCKMNGIEAEALRERLRDNYA